MTWSNQVIISKKGEKFIINETLKNFTAEYVYIYIQTQIYNSNPFPHKINCLAVLTLLLYPPIITKIKTYNIEMTLYIYYILLYISVINNKS